MGRKKSKDAQTRPAGMSRYAQKVARRNSQKYAEESVAGSELTVDQLSQQLDEALIERQKRGGIKI